MRSLKLALPLCLTVTACLGDSPPESTARIALEVAPLTLSGVTDAEYRITVTNALAQEVWTKTVRATSFGDGRGSLSYVGPCDAQSSPNTVRLELLSLYTGVGAAMDPTSYVLPGPLTKEVTCTPNADTAVTFDVTVMRDAKQGFFDIAVEFDDIFCSAKLDCLDELLLRPDGSRDATTVVAFACTTGQAQGAAEPLYLYMDDVRIECTDYTSGSPVVLPAVRVPVGPAYDGNQGAIGAHVYQHALYRGEEDLPGYAKCFWNTAIGIDPAALASDKLACRVVGKATASPSDWRPGNSTGLGRVWPTVTWNVPLTTFAGGNVSNACVGASARHPLNASGSGVATSYSSSSAPTSFENVYPCDPNGGAPAPVQACARAQATFGSNASATQDERNLVLTIDGATGTIPLPVGAIVDTCCANGCCSN